MKNNRHFYPMIRNNHYIPQAAPNLYFNYKNVKVHAHPDHHQYISASARISKGQGYQGFLRKRAGSSFGQKRAICGVQGKT
jgi:hypothetical protein